MTSNHAKTSNQNISYIPVKRFSFTSPTSVCVREKKVVEKKEQTP